MFLLHSMKFIARSRSGAEICASWEKVKASLARTSIAAPTVQKLVKYIEAEWLNLGSLWPKAWTDWGRFEAGI